MECGVLARNILAILHLRTAISDLDGMPIHGAPDIRAAINAAFEAMVRGALDLPTIVSFIDNGVEKLVERSLLKTGGLTKKSAPRST